MHNRKLLASKVESLQTSALKLGLSLDKLYSITSSNPVPRASNPSNDNSKNNICKKYLIYIKSVGKELI